ncbi:hypothetical protein M9458_024089, partial [Cirrhinus mrigala]
VWTERHLPPRAASTLPASRGSVLSGERVSCSASSLCQETRSAATAVRPTLAGPASTSAFCSASSAPAFT